MKSSSHMEGWSFSLVTFLLLSVDGLELSCQHEVTKIFALSLYSIIIPLD